MPSNPNAYNHIIHAADDKGVFCGSEKGQVTRDYDTVTCNKCKRIVNGELDLNLIRKHRKLRKEKLAQEEANKFLK